MLTLTPIAGFGVAFVLALVLTPWVRRWAKQLQAVDRGSPAKVHEHDVPRLGGIAIAIAFYVPIGALALRTNLYQSRLYEDPRRAAALLLGGLVILALGIYDDLVGTKAWQKLLVQIPLAMLAWWAGIRVGRGTSPTGEMMALGPVLSLAVTTLWIVGVINAINLIDGLDGLASGIALQALVVVALCAWHRDQPVLVLVSLCLSGAVGGFLFHNFHPAGIFMGDSGSMLLGYILAVSSTWSTQKSATAIGVVLPVLAMGLPLLDTSLAVWRRLVRRQSPLSGDMDHIHHRALRRGWSHRRAVFTLYGIALFFNLLSVFLIYVEDLSMVWPISAVAVLAAFGVAYALGYLGVRPLIDSAASTHASVPERPTARRAQ